MDKPTPTFLPPGTAFFHMPAQVSLWGSTDYAIQSWNMLQNGRTVIQAIFIIAGVIVGGYVLVRNLEAFTRKDSQE